VTDIPASYLGCPKISFFIEKGYRRRRKKNTRDDLFLCFKKVLKHTRQLSWVW
jgi:hypothetical protein